MSVEKAGARRRARRKRARLADASAGPAIARHFPIERFKGQVVAGYMPMRNELDVMPLLQKLSDAGMRLVLPCTPHKQAPLLFRGWSPGEALTEGLYGTQEPYGTAQVLRPDVLLVPLLAFTDGGDRLGYGGGYYDRTIAALRTSGEVFACGVAYSGQRQRVLPVGEYDEPLDGLVTEKDFRTF